MTSNYHTPIVEGAAANAQTFNGPMAEFDQALTDALLTEKDGHIIQEEGVDLAQQARLDFVGAGVTVTNEVGKTKVTIPGGVTDHGALSGLSDDDHAQYLLKSGLREWDEQGSDPSTPTSGKWKLYFKSDGLYLIDDTGLVMGPLGLGAELYNYLDNCGFEYTQHILTTASSASMTDGGYDMFDRWYSLIQGAGATVSQGGAVGASRKSLKLTAGGTTNRYGVAQILEATKSRALRGKTIIKQIKIKPTNNAGSGSRDYRVAILEWTGTADSPAKDVVNDWTSSNFTTGNFFKSTTLSLVGTAVETIAHGAEAIISVSGTVSASCNNLIVFVWVEDVPTHASDYAELSEAGFYTSSMEQTWKYKDNDFDNCLFHFERITTGTQYGFFGVASVTSATNARTVISMHRKRTTPNLSASGSTTFMVQDVLGVNFASTAVSLSYPTDVGFLVQVTTAGSMTAGVGFVIDNGGDSVFGAFFISADIGV